MAKKRNKKKNTDSASMDISTPTVGDLPQAMGTSETTAPGVLSRKIKKGIPVRRSKNLRKIRAIEKAISQSEKSEVKISKNESKTLRTASAKMLYD